MRDNWEIEIQMPPHENCTSYCRKCNTFRYWRRVAARILKCATCGREVTV